MEMNNKDIQFVIGAEGKPTAVLVDIVTWERDHPGFRRCRRHPDRQRGVGCPRCGWRGSRKGWLHLIGTSQSGCDK